MPGGGLWFFLSTPCPPSPSSPVGGSVCFTAACQSLAVRAYAVIMNSMDNWMAGVAMFVRRVSSGLHAGRRF